MIDHSGAWLPSITLGLAVLGVGALLLVAVLVIASLAGWTDDHGLSGWGLLGILAALSLAVMAFGAGFGYYPYNGDYHRLQPATGTVKAVDSRFLAASQYVVVTYDTGLTVRCDDSRCATVRVGETLRLLCTKEHQFGSPLGADGWGCRWGGIDG